MVATREHPPFVSGPASSNPTVTGKLSAIGDASFTIDVKKSQDPEPMQFLIDDNTKLEGKLTVGAQATVEYRASDNGKKRRPARCRSAGGISSRTLIATAHFSLDRGILLNPFALDASSLPARYFFEPRGY
jgi:hypothetical protein